ncbi:MAG: hypothetical protein KIT86_21075 [Hydrogenophaga sp.]|uniref:hypothetical protein n=1 Tax=Hydrogenophaga sp. TaxID=1904254 RepID=UPI002616A78B|nr:hypothetical protein [Hydrogenophaga sp.]MCW5672159.1 hypothetical protein [Hydrogenophaga sp.]
MIALPARRFLERGRCAHDRQQGVPERLRIVKQRRRNAVLWHRRTLGWRPGRLARTWIAHFFNCGWSR